MESDAKFNPYHRPSSYDVLGLADGPATPTREIGRVYNDQLRKSRTIRDTGERSRRMEELKLARDQLLRPDDRVLLDFFMVGGDLFNALCTRYAREVSATPVAAGEVLRELFPTRRHDDLLPLTPDALTEEFLSVEVQFFEEPGEAARLPLTTSEF